VRDNYETAGLHGLFFIAEPDRAGAFISDGTARQSWNNNSSSQLARWRQRSRHQVVKSRSVSSSQIASRIARMPDTALLTVADTDS